MQDRSFTVPQTDNSPIFPPGKKLGETTKPSVDMAIFPFGACKTAASSPVKSGLSKYFLKIEPIKEAVCAPPAPCAKVITFSIFYPHFIAYL